MTEARSARVLRATIEYDGTRYRGWQSQVNARTVQGALYHAVRPVLGEGTRIFGAGRTDAGVHAFGQVASLALERSVAGTEVPRLRRDLNDRLPPDVHVLALDPAPAGFHARHDAALRIYRYRLSRRRTAFGKPWVWWVRDSLDAAAMRRAAALVVGRHDFSSFCENPAGHDSTLVEVGRGRWHAEKVAGLLTAPSTEPARVTAPPSGLFLEAVLYEGDPPPPEIDPLRPGF
ncbi:MAG TPA: tRNA pseudouridine(38-40) synthase TruA [Thermoanaerobaculia bacterium]|nr:tRNA pseudouridine(38-40) synthase TruA [Thermoanaerobaculia bacterium]